MKTVPSSVAVLSTRYEPRPARVTVCGSPSRGTARNWVFTAVDSWCWLTLAVGEALHDEAAVDKDGDDGVRRLPGRADERMVAVGVRVACAVALVPLTVRRKIVLRVDGALRRLGEVLVDLAEQVALQRQDRDDADDETGRSEEGGEDGHQPPAQGAGAFHGAGFRM